MKLARNLNFNSSPTKKHVKNKGIIRASYAASFAAIPASLAGIGIMGAMRKVSQLSKEDSVTLSKATQDGLKQTGLYEKGVRAYRVKEIASKKRFTFPDFFLSLLPDKKDAKAINAIKEEIEASPIVKFFSKNPATAKFINEFSDGAASKQALNFKLGLNACYLPHANKIITPDKSLRTSVFHEMGHALNNNGGKALKLLQKARPMALIVPGLILLSSLMNKRKTTDEKSDNKVQNAFDKVKKNAGKLTFAAMLPMIAEEGIASLRGGKIAKNLFKQGKLTKGILNKVRLTNLGGFTSYVIAAVGTALATKAAIKVKDNIQAKYEQKLEIKQAKKMHEN